MAVGGRVVPILGVTRTSNPPGTPKMGNTRPPTATMRPSYSFTTHKVVYALFLRTSAHQRKLVKSLGFYCSHMLN